MTESAEPSERYVSAKNVETPCDRFEFYVTFCEESEMTA